MEPPREGTRKPGGVALEPSLNRTICAICGDYARRREYVATHADECAEHYAAVNTAIDGAIAEAMPEYDGAAREAMREDIGTRRGATYTPLYQMSAATYKRLKRRVKTAIARALGYA